MIHFSFLTLEEKAHLQMLHSWLNEHHVIERWHSTPSLAAVRDDYFSDDEPGTERFIACFDGDPIGYVQKYLTIHAEAGWWADERSPGTAGIDFFIGSTAHLNHGLAPQMIDAFVRMLLKDETIVRIIADPAPDNLRSIGCLKKAGFRVVGDIETPDGQATLMERLREDR